MLTMTRRQFMVGAAGLTFTVLARPVLALGIDSRKINAWAAIDADGCMWSAHWGGGCVVRYTPDGRIDRTLPVPTRQPSCVCFAGSDLDILCVTSAREGMTDETLRADPHAGNVFFYRTGVQGLREPEYRP